MNSGLEPKWPLVVGGCGCWGVGWFVEFPAMPSMAVFSVGNIRRKRCSRELRSIRGSERCSDARSTLSDEERDEDAKISSFGFYVFLDLFGSSFFFFCVFFFGWRAIETDSEA